MEGVLAVFLKQSHNVWRVECFLTAKRILHDMAISSSALVCYYDEITEYGVRSTSLVQCLRAYSRIGPKRGHSLGRSSILSLTRLMRSLRGLFDCSARSLDIRTPYSVHTHYSVLTQAHPIPAAPKHTHICSCCGVLRTPNFLRVILRRCSYELCVCVCV